MTTITGHGARDKLEQLIEDAVESHVPVTIIGKRHDAVLISAEDWAAIQTTLAPAAPPEEDDLPDRGLAAREEAQFTGDYCDAEDVAGQLDALLADSETKPTPAATP
ncbi:MAG: type II toxin-antitoxin system prevent-host-death family antitoxin [Pseudomonadota bacterium]|nr:type II toxin-antitoxin system prevent-host-death family antitoxin [Pseudomonadota bacterium]